MPKFEEVKKEWMKDPLVLAEVLGLVSGVVLAVPAVRLLRLQRRISRLSPIADDGKSKEGRQLASDLRQQYKEGLFGFSWFDATCAAPRVAAASGVGRDEAVARSCVAFIAASVVSTL